MRLVNLTGHPLVLGTEKNRYRFPSKGRTRINASYDVEGDVVIDLDTGDTITVPILVTGTGELVSLPKPEPDTLYVVSGLVAGKVRRPDVLSPARLHRQNGKVEYAMALMRYQ